MIIDIIKFLEEIERKIPVDNWKVSGIKIWPLIRIILSFEVISFNLGRKSNKIKSFWEKLKYQFQRALSFLNVYRSIIHDRKKNAKELQSDICLLSRSSSKNTKIGESWLDSPLDSFKFYFEKLDKSFVHFEYDTLNVLRIPRYSSSKFIHNNMEICKLKAAITIKLSKKIPVNIPEFKRFQEILHSYGISSSINSRQDIIYHTQVLKCRAEFFKKKLKNQDVKTAFCTVYYNPEGMAYILACNELNIPSIDIQHGNQGDYHPAYSGWTYGKDQQLLPTYFWVWSEYEKNVIQKWVGKMGPKVVVGGNLWVNFWADETNPILKNVLPKIQKIKNHYPHKIHILLSLQPIVSFEVFLPIIKKAPQSWLWWIRLHPRMLEQRDEIAAVLNESKITNFCITEASYLPLPPILSNMDIHVTYNSSVIIEAELFGLKSVAIADNSTELFPKYFELEFAYYENSVDNAIMRIQTILTAPIEIKKHMINNAKNKLRDFMEQLEKSTT